MKTWLQQRRVLTALGLLSILVIAGLVIFFLPVLLIAPAQTTTADVILHYALAPQLETDEYVAQLYHQKLAKKVVCISKATDCGNYLADDARQHLLALGVPAEDVLTLHLPFTDCVGESLPHVTAMVQANGWQHALIVVRPVFSRFGGRVLTKHFQQAGIQASITYSPQDQQELTTRWWSGHQKAQLTIDAAISALLDPLYPECR